MPKKQGFGFQGQALGLWVSRLSFRALVFKTWVRSFRFQGQGLGLWVSRLTSRTEQTSKTTDKADRIDRADKTGRQTAPRKLAGQLRHSARSLGARFFFCRTFLTSKQNKQHQQTDRRTEQNKQARQTGRHHTT